MYRVWLCLLFAGPLAAATLLPAERGVPAALAGEARLEQRGAYLLLTARLPEPGGKVLARSIGRNPVWEKDALAAPELEDRVRWRIRAAGRGFEIEINPWGAYRVAPEIEIRRWAEVTVEGWRVEASVPLSALEAGANLASVQWAAERIRSRRPLAPEFRWKWPADSEFADLRLSADRSGAPPEIRPLAIGNAEPPLEIGRVATLPPIRAGWDDPAWQPIPTFGLRRNEPDPRSPRYPAEIKWAHDGRTLALLARLEEPEPVVARNGGRDSALAGDDHLSIYLATSGSRFVEILVNPVGALRDALGTGPRMSQPRTSWNAHIETLTSIRHGYWVARIDIPLQECAAALGESSIPHEWRLLVARYRAGRPGEAAEWSSLPSLDGRATFYGPARYRAMVLREEAPARVKSPGIPPPAQDAHVWTPFYRRFHAVRSMVSDFLRRKTEQAVLAERQDWQRVETRAEWERFRDERIARLKTSVGVFPPPLLLEGLVNGRNIRLDQAALERTLAPAAAAYRAAGAAPNLTLDSAAREIAQWLIQK